MIQRKVLHTNNNGDVEVSGGIEMANNTEGEEGQAEQEGGLISEEHLPSPNVPPQHTPVLKKGYEDKR